jgi:hypothetical protein
MHPLAWILSGSFLSSVLLSSVASHDDVDGAPTFTLFANIVIQLLVLGPLVAVAFNTSGAASLSD